MHDVLNLIVGDIARAQGGIEARKLPQSLLEKRTYLYYLTACIVPLPREDWQMDVLSITMFALIAIIVVAAGVYVMRPEKHQ